MTTNTKDVSFYLYADLLMSKLQEIGDSVKPYTINAGDENDVQTDIINVQQDIQTMTNDAMTKQQIDHATVDKFAQDVNKLGIDAKALSDYQTANHIVDDGLGAQALSTYTMITGTGPGTFGPTPIGNIGQDIAAYIDGGKNDGDDTALFNDLNTLATYYQAQKTSTPPAGSPQVDLGPLDDWVNNGYQGGVSTSALDTNLGAQVNTNNNKLNTWSTLIQQLDQVAQNVISSLSSLWGTMVSNTSPSLTSA